MSTTSKDLIGVYDMLCSTTPERIFFKPFIIPFIIFSFSEIHNTGIPMHAWGKDNMG